MSRKKKQCDPYLTVEFAVWFWCRIYAKNGLKPVSQLINFWRRRRETYLIYLSHMPCTKTTHRPRQPCNHLFFFPQNFLSIYGPSFSWIIKPNIVSLFLLSSVVVWTIPPPHRTSFLHLIYIPSFQLHY